MYITHPLTIKPKIPILNKVFNYLTDAIIDKKYFTTIYYKNRTATFEQLRVIPDRTKNRKAASSRDFRNLCNKINQGFAT